MNKRALSIVGVAGLMMVWLSIAFTVLADNEVPSAQPVAPEQAPRTDQQARAPQPTTVGSLFISEVLPAAAPGKPAGIELAVEVQQIFLPLIARGGNPGASPNTAGGEITAHTVALTLSDVIISSYQMLYALPDALPPVPPNGIIVVYIGVTGTDDLDFGDGVATLYASNIDTDLFQRGGYVGLLNTTPATPTRDDYILWGSVTLRSPRPSWPWPPVSGPAARCLNLIRALAARIRSAYHRCRINRLAVTPVNGCRIAPGTLHPGGSIRRRCPCTRRHRTAA